MSELISGKEAAVAYFKDIEVQTRKNNESNWKLVTYGMTLAIFLNDEREFRLKPRTITLNGIEVPAPFKPVEGDAFYYLSTEDECGYDYKSFVDGYPYFDGNKIQFGAWQNEDEIKQVVDALRSVFEID